MRNYTTHTGRDAVGGLQQTIPVENVPWQKKAPPLWRQRAVDLVRHGWSMRAVSRILRVSLCTVQCWFGRAQGRRLEEVDWSDRPPGCARAANRTLPIIERRIISLRRDLRRSPLGEVGAATIHRMLVERGLAVPGVRTIGRILLRHGAVDGRKRIRHAAPPRGWYLPDVADRTAELDSFDVVEGLAIEGHGEIDVLNGISLHGGLPASWPRDHITSKTTVHALLEHWSDFGLPAYAQFDNDTRFQGPRQYPDSFGRVMRLCLSLAVVPVFVPPCEMGFQAAIENFNGRWQSKVWRRFRHPSLDGLQQRSEQFMAALRERLAARLEAAPARRPFPDRWKLNWQQPLRGKVIFLRRTTETGRVNFLVRDFFVDRLWVHRLVRAEVDLDAGQICFYALRRREPEQQRLLRTVPYVTPCGHFRE